MNAPEKVTLTGRHVRLEPMEERHRDDLLAAAAQDPATFRYLFVDLSRGEPAWDIYFADAMKPEYVSWATVDAATGRAVGSSRFLDIAPEHGRLEIGWTWITPSHQRTAVNTEAKLLQLAYAFDELGANRVALKTDLRNERSQAAIARIGGVREGILREQFRMPDGYMRSSVYFSILAAEWPAVPDWWYAHVMADLRRAFPDVAFFVACTGSLADYPALAGFDAFDLPTAFPYGYKGPSHSAKRHPAADLFALAGCRVVIGSPCSTFSHYAADMLGEPTTLLVPPAEPMTRAAASYRRLDLYGRGAHDYYAACRTGQGLVAVADPAQLPVGRGAELGWL